MELNMNEIFIVMFIIFSILVTVSQSLRITKLEERIRQLNQR
ncbi:hypothetical protein [Macrococcoides canis]